MRTPADGQTGPLFTPSAAQVARDSALAVEKARADRAWRRAVARIVILALLGQAAAIAIAAAAWGVGDEETGQLLVAAGEAGVVGLPFLIVVLWIAEAHRNGDL